MKYFGEFEDKQSIAEAFRIKINELEGCDILFASYEYENYSGYSIVVFSKDGQLYEVDGSHCSCRGLEGQWQPEETSVAALKMRNQDLYRTRFPEWPKFLEKLA